MAVLPQRLLEKVFTPLVVHSHIWVPDGLTSGVSAATPLCGDAGTRDAAAVLDGAPDSGAMPGVATVGALPFGIFAFNAAVASVGMGGMAWLEACAGVVLPVKPTTMAIAMAAMDSPPKIHGRRSLSSVIARLSSCHTARAANMTDCQRTDTLGLRTRREDREWQLLCRGGRAGDDFDRGRI